MNKSIPSNPYITLHLLAKHARNKKLEALSVEPSEEAQRFHALHTFRQQITSAKAGLLHQPYTYIKKNIFWYRLIFVAFGLLFITLGFTSVSMRGNSGFGALFQSHHLIKSALSYICALFAFSSFLLAFLLNATRDAALRCTKKAKRNLLSLYQRKKTLLGFTFFSWFGKRRAQVSQLKHHYQEVYNQINDKRESALHLLHRIEISCDLEVEEKEVLYNQTLEELNDTLQAIHYSFERERFQSIA